MKIKSLMLGTLLCWSANNAMAQTEQPDTAYNPYERINELETKLEKVEKEQFYNEVWKRRKEWQLRYNMPSVKKEGGRGFEYDVDYSFGIKRNKTKYFHKKPIAGKVKIGLDYSIGLSSLQYAKLKPKYKVISANAGTGASNPDGFDEIITNEPSVINGILGDIDLGTHMLDYNLVHIGPRISYNPIGKMIVSTYAHVAVGGSFLILNDNFSWALSIPTTAGLEVSYKAIALGVEYTWNKTKYKQIDFDEIANEEEGSDEGSFKFNKFLGEKFTLKRNTFSAYVAFRF